DAGERQGALGPPTARVVEDHHDGLGEAQPVDREPVLDLDPHAHELARAGRLGLARDAQQLPARAARGPCLEDPCLAVRGAEPRLVGLLGVRLLVLLLPGLLLALVLRARRRRVAQGRGRDRHEVQTGPREVVDDARCRVLLMGQRPRADPGREAREDHRNEHGDAHHPAARTRQPHTATIALRARRPRAQAPRGLVPMTSFHVLIRSRGSSNSCGYDRAVAETPETVRRTRMTRDAQREQVLQIAQELFATQGYHHVSMDDIADQALVSKPVLYRHFPSKLDLYLARSEEHTSELQSR